MRATLADVVRHPSWLASWWLDWPGRRRWWWREVLREPGQGWLRWAGEQRTTPYSGYHLDPPEPYYVAPPARRIAWMARAVVTGATRDLGQWWSLFIDPERRRMWRQG